MLLLFQVCSAHVVALGEEKGKLTSIGSPMLEQEVLDY